MSEEPIPLEPADAQPVPVPVPPANAGENAEGPQPVPVPVPAAKKEEEKIALVDWDEEETSSTQRKAIGSKLHAGQHKSDDEYKRPLNFNGTGATRCRLFHSKIADAGLVHMENSINEWLDEGEIEVKFATQCIGTLEGKTPVPNLFVVVWY